MDNLWEPALKIVVGTGQLPQQIIPETVPTITEALKAMPRAIHANFLTSEAFLWSSLQQVNLTIPITDLTLKYGGTVSGEWNLLYILDAWADGGEPPDTTGWSGGLMIDGILTANAWTEDFNGKAPSLDWNYSAHDLSQRKRMATECPGRLKGFINACSGITGTLC